MPIGWQELLIILFIVIIIFGAGTLPEIGGALGRGIKEFRQATQELEEQEQPGSGAPDQSEHRA